MSNIDLFSSQASQYLVFRPIYPETLYKVVTGACKQLKNVWDCGTGNGQAATYLANYFEQVTASDINYCQLLHSQKADNIDYLLASAENSGFADNSFDLIVAAQAAHWFKYNDFVEEAQRVLRPNGILAIWGYGLLSVSPKIDALIDDFYKNIVGKYWAAERRHVENAYQELSFESLLDIHQQAFEINVSWSLEQLIGYLNTWSSVQIFRQVEQYNPVELLVPQLTRIWKEEFYTVRFPVFLKMGKVNK